MTLTIISAILFLLACFLLYAARGQSSVKVKIKRGHDYVPLDLPEDIEREDLTHLILKARSH